MRKIKIIYVFCLFCIGKMLAKIYLIFKDRKYYVFCERGTDAQDNAYVMYKYFVENGKKSKYLISKKSTDSKKININDLIRYESFKHYFYINCAKAVISTHEHHYLGTYSSRLRSKYKINSKFVFLQHGVIKENHPESYYPNISCDIFLTTAILEYENIKKFYGYPDGVVQLLGMPRYDFLEDSSDEDNKILLIMPTFRRWIKDNDFQNSIYYESYYKLLTSNELINLCKDKNIKIYFYLHSQFQKFSTYFKKVENDFLKIVRYGEESVQNLLRKSNWLITDYSSVAIDFGYMRKPVLYYQFDSNEYFSKHYEHGYFDYYKDGFGPVSITLEELISNFKKMLNCNFEYNDRTNKFFKYFDQENRKRVMEAILKL